MRKSQVQRKAGAQQYFQSPGRAITAAEASTVRCIRRLTLPAQTLTTLTGVVLTTGTVTSCGEWASESSRWCEARVLAIRAHLIPNTTAGFPMIVATERSGALTAPGSAAVAYQMASAKLIYIGATVGKVQCVEARALDLEDQNFDAVGALANRFAIQMFNPSGVTQGYYVEFIVEFRGSR